MRLVLISLAALLALVGCTKTLDLESAEESFATRIEDETGVSLASVTCPEDVVAEQGSTFECRATADDGTEIDLTVRQTDGEGNVSFDEPLLHTPEAERSLAGQLGPGAAVDCPDLVLVRQGHVVTCQAETRDGKRALELTFEDDEGTYSAELLPAA